MPLIPCPDCGHQISDVAPACIHCGRPMGPTPAPGTPTVGPQISDTVAAEARSRSYTRRIVAGVVGSGLLLVTMVGADSSSEGLAPAAIAGVGAALGSTVAWVSTRGSPHGLRWPRLVLASIAGSILALLAGIAAYGSLDRPDAIGFAIGAGLSYGTLLGGAVAFLIYALKDLPPLD